MRRLLTLLALASAFVFSASARADSFNYVFSDGGSYSGRITFTGSVDPANSAAFDITSVTGTINGVSVTLAGVPAGANSQNVVVDNANLFAVDNVLYTQGLPPGSDLVFDAQGGILVTDGTNFYEFYSDGTQMLLSVWLSVPGQDPSQGYQNPVPITVSSVPEPSTLAMSATGIFALAGMARRKFRNGDLAA